ncbi:hypothetical protein [Chitinophaga flava]|uniref:Lipoprotein n=1 Tax=Chitinophaga flava TaxID=2259036 RepID=A0A365Y1L2_9BACT|nr:hypothetical protein [Chitinophaga flava]RBL91814.1 hypothetical protein DF182_04210 [Chitinophaga flava]
MKKHFIFLLPALMTIACVNRNNQQTEVKTDSATVSTKPAPVQEQTASTASKETDGQSQAWTDSLLIEFIKSTDNQLIRYAAKDSSIRWMMDQVETTDSAVFMIFHLGHHTEEADHSDPRFVTDGWVYIDTLTRKVYEYDVAADSLKRWYKK